MEWVFRSGQPQPPRTQHCGKYHIYRGSLVPASVNQKNKKIRKARRAHHGLAEPIGRRRRIPLRAVTRGRGTVRRHRGYKNASASEAMQNAKMYNAYAQCNYQTYKTKRSKTKTYRANQNKSQRSKGVTSPKLPSQASKGVLLKQFGENICGLPL